MDEEQSGFIVGFIAGIIITILIWVAVAEQVELAKIRNGYLTCKTKTYAVTLYDTLDVPEKEVK